MQWEGTDRRKFPRVIYPCLVKVICNNSTQDILLAHTENISRGGVCVIVKKEVKLFSPVNLEIDLLDVDEHIYATGKVAWSVRRKSIEKIKPMFYDLGIEFLEISSKDQQRLNDTIDRLIKSGAKLSKPYI